MTVNHMKISKDLFNYMQNIIDAGYECYLVGGAVRDYILGKNNKDYDLATNIPFEELKKLIPSISIMKENNHRNTAIIRCESIDYEFSLYRGLTITEDLSNRDFIINAIAVDLNGNFIDPFNGLGDLRKKKLSLVKSNGDGLVDDPLRILRALRQSDKYGLIIADNTKREILKKAHLLKNVAKERIIRELYQILLSNNISDYLLGYKEIFFEIIPELKVCDGFEQKNEYHIYDIYSHTVKVVSNTNKNIYLRLAALFHDIGKPQKFIIDKDNVGHFLNHATTSYEIFKKFAKEYKLDNKTTKIVGDLILYHEDELSNKKSKIYDFYKKYNMNRIELLFELKKSDIKSQNPKFIERLEIINNQEKKYIEVRDKIKSIAFNGNDIISLGFDGKIVGIILNDVKRKIVNDDLINERKCIEKYIINNYKDGDDNER